MLKLSHQYRDNISSHDPGSFPQDKLLLGSLAGSRHGASSPDLRSDEEGHTDDEDLMEGNGGGPGAGGGVKGEEGADGKGGKIRKKKTRTVFSRSQVKTKIR